MGAKNAAGYKSRIIALYTPEPPRKPKQGFGRRQATLVNLEFNG